MATEHKVALGTDPGQTGVLARPAVQNPYLQLSTTAPT